MPERVLMPTVVLILFYLLFPVVAIYLAKHNSLGNKLGAVVICYIVGIIIGNIGVLPSGIAAVQNPLMLVTISLALPLMFFSIDVRRWTRLAGKSLLSFFIQVVAILLVAGGGFFIFRGWVGKETWKLSGMFVGLYTGGTVNLGAIATALRTNQTSLPGRAYIRCDYIFNIPALSDNHRAACFALFSAPFQPVDKEAENVK